MQLAVRVQERQSAKLSTLTQAVLSLVVPLVENQDNKKATGDVETTDRKVAEFRQIIHNIVANREQLEGVGTPSIDAASEDRWAVNTAWEEAAHEEAAEAAKEWAEIVKIEVRNATYDSPVRMEIEELTGLVKDLRRQFEEAIGSFRGEEPMEWSEIKRLKMTHIGLFAKLAVVMSMWTGLEVTGKHWSIEKQYGPFEPLSCHYATFRVGREPYVVVKTTKGIFNTRDFRTYQERRVPIRGRDIQGLQKVAYEWSRLVDSRSFQSYLNEVDKSLVGYFSNGLYPPLDDYPPEIATRQFLDVRQVYETAKRLVEEKTEEVEVVPISSD